VDSFEAFFLDVILEFAVETVFPVPIGVVPWSGGKMLGECGHRVRLLLFVQGSGRLPFLEGSNFFVLIFIVP
jgi:hypothetical protein